MIRITSYPGHHLQFRCSLPEITHIFLISVAVQPGHFVKIVPHLLRQSKIWHSLSKSNNFVADPETVDTENFIASAHTLSHIVHRKTDRQTDTAVERSSFFGIITIFCSACLYACVWFSGVIGMSARDIAQIMTETVVEFAAKSPVHLHRITVCIFQPQMIQEFADAVAAKLSSTSWKKTVRGICVVTFLFYWILFALVFMWLLILSVYFCLLPYCRVLWTTRT